MTKSTTKKRPAKPSPPRTAEKRDPSRTRSKILAAATAEFAENGFAGARVDEIARASGANKRMLYHYYGSKKGLFHEVMRTVVGEKWSALAKIPDDPRDYLAQCFDVAMRDPRWVRLLAWEALQPSRSSKQPLRDDGIGFGQGTVERGRGAGLLCEDLDSGRTLLAFIALTLFPIAFPQITKLCTGLVPDAPQFRGPHREFLEHFAEHMQAHVHAKRPPGNAK